MIVFRHWRTRNGAGMRLKGARRARRLRPGLSAAKVGRRHDMGPLKRSHWRRGRRDIRCGRSLAIVPRDPECGQLLQERPPARFRRGEAVLRLPHRAQLVLRHLRQVLDLRHARRPSDRLLRGGRNEFLLLRFIRFEAGLDRVREACDGRDSLFRQRRRIRLSQRRASRTRRREGARAREGFRPGLGADRLDLFDRLLIDAGGHDGNAHHAVERRIRRWRRG